MNRFLKKIIAFVGLLLPILFIVMLCWFYYFEVPPPNFSNSPSFNEKIQFLKKNDPNKDLDVLAIGSSMTLNNLHTNTIVDEFNTERFLNASSWGQNMKENFTLLKILDALYHPKNLVISSNVMDFRKGDKIFRYELLNDYLNASPKTTSLYYFKSFRLQYLINSSRELKTYRSCLNDYQYLGYDEYGGVNFSADKFNISSSRWNGVPLTNFKTDDIQYQYLDSISSFCNSKNIKLYFFQSPLRQGFISKLNEKEITFFDTHINKVQKILNDNGHLFANSNKRVWPDSLFIDFSHLNNKGAKLYTEYSLDYFNNRADNIK